MLSKLKEEKVFLRMAAVVVLTSAFAMLVGGIYYFSLYPLERNILIRGIILCAVFLPVILAIYLFGVVRRWTVPIDSFFSLIGEQSESPPVGGESPPVGGAPVHSLSAGGDLPAAQRRRHGAQAGARTGTVYDSDMVFKARQALLSFPLKAFLSAVVFWAVGALLGGLLSARIMGISRYKALVGGISIFMGGTLASLFAYYLYKEFLSSFIRIISRHIQVDKGGRKIVTIKQKLIFSFLILIFISLSFSTIMGYTRAVSAIRNQAAEFMGEEIKDVGESGLYAESYKEDMKSLLKSSMGLIIITVCISIIMAILLSRDVSNPILAIMDVSRSISSGDLGRDVGVLTDDEIGELALSSKRMVGNLRGMIERLGGVSGGLMDVVEGISEGSRSVNKVSSSQVDSVDVAFSSIGEIDGIIREIAGQTELLTRSAGRGLDFVVELDRKIEEISFDVDGLSRSVEETTSSISEMSASAKEVAGSVDELLSLAGETASAMVEMDASIKQVEENAAETARVSERVMGDAEGGMEAVRTTIGGMERIKGVSEHAFGVIKDLSERVGEIGRILTLIDEVAEDTNLLALNAAIIAAQAGESGMNFAVVSDEIRELAQRTEGHTEDISNIIRSVQVESGRALEAVRDGVSVVEEGVTLSGRAGDALDKILGGSRLSLGMVKQIAMACGEQAISSRRVSEAMERVRGMVEAVARATSEQSRGGEQIEVAVEKMRELSLRAKRSTKEQSGFSKNVISNLEKIKKMIDQISRAAKEQTDSTSKMVESIKEINSTAKKNLSSVSNLTETIMTLKNQSDLFKRELEGFKI